jgi:hypothetical protein
MGMDDLAGLDFSQISRVKIWVYVPREQAKAVRIAMGRAGGGVIGNYAFCAFIVEGRGHFLPEEGANPSIGELGTLEAVSEVRIEIECSLEKVRAVVEAIKATHPYEEVPIDILPLLDVSLFLNSSK